MSEGPFIHIIEMPYGKYIYDVNTNRIVKVNNEIINLINKDIDRKEEISKCEDEKLKELKEKGILSEHRPKIIIHPQNENLEYILSNKLSNLILQVTQNCNFRCSYCVYSGSSDEKQRKHSNKRMSLNIAKKALDFLLKNSGESERIYIAFYGGEPLLEIDMIRKVVEYAEDLFEGKEIIFTITTNGSLLKNDIVQFLIDKNFDVLVSLDGPKDIHDKERIFMNNVGSFDVVEKNLINIKQNYPEFYNKITFNMVVDPRNSLEHINTIFNNETFKNNRFQQVEIEDDFLEGEILPNNKYFEDREYEEFKGILAYFNRLPSEYVNGFSRQKMSEIDSWKDKLESSYKLGDSMSHGGPCIPGESKVFVTAEGVFYPCERVSETSEVMKIGNINEGFYIDKVRKLLNVAKITEEKCKKCWAITNCNLCVKFADGGDKLLKEKVMSYCEQVRYGVENSLKEYITIKEIEEKFKGNIC